MPTSLKSINKKNRDLLVSGTKVSGVVLGAIFLLQRYGWDKISFDHLIYCATLFSVFFCYFHEKKGGLSFLEPLGLFLIGFSFYFLIRPYEILFLQKKMAYSPDGSLTETLCYVFVGFWCAYFGYKISFGRRMANGWRVPCAEFSYKRFCQAVVGMLVLSGFFVVARLGLFSPLCKEAVSSSFLYQLPFVLVPPVALIALSKRGLWRTMFLVMYCISVAIWAFQSTGNRRDLIFIALSPVIIWHYMRKNVPDRLLVLAVPVAIVLMLQMAIWRTSLFIDREDRWSYFQRTNQLLLITNDFRDKIVNALDYRVAYDALAYFVNNLFSSKEGLLWGLSYVRPFLVSIPRSIWPEKPLDITLVSASRIDPQWGEKGVSLGPTFMGEMYLNFAGPGIILGMFLVGICIRVTASYIRRAPKNPKIILLYAVIAPHLFIGMRGGFHGTILSLTLIYLVPITLILWVSKGKKGRQFLPLMSVRPRSPA